MSQGARAQYFHSTYDHLPGTSATGQASHDQYSITPSHTLGHEVMAGNLILGPSTQDIHIMEVDDHGIIVWETALASWDVPKVYHIEQTPFVGTGGYVLGGAIIDGTGNTESLILLLDAVGNQVANLTIAVPGWNHTTAMHVVPVGFGASSGVTPGYLLTGIVAQGFAPTDSKQGWAALLDPSLGLVWSQTFNSATSASLEDWDMLSNGISVDNGFFFSGSSNGTSKQNALALRTDAAGNLMWQDSYYFDPLGSDTNAAVSAVYDPASGSIFQLANSTDYGSFTISAYDSNAGAAVRLPNDMAFSSTIYGAAAGYSLNLAPNGQSLVVSGKFQTCSYGAITGSMPFQVSVQKDASALDWSYIHPLDGPGYATLPGIFLGFSAFSQPRIYTPEMASVKADGTGYVLLGLNYSAPTDPRNLELIEIKEDGFAACAIDFGGFGFAPEHWHSEAPVNSALALPTVGSHLFDSYGVSGNRTSCGSILPAGPSCTLPDEIVLDVVQGQFCEDRVLCVRDQDGNFLSPDLCFDVDWGDGTTASYAGDECPYHEYTDLDGIYDVCVEVYCCADGNNGVDLVTTCVEVVIEGCGGTSCELPDASLVEVLLVQLDADDCYTIAACPGTTDSDNPSLGADYCIDWDWGDGSVQTNTAEFCPFHTYAADGTYTVCANIYCCDDPTAVLTICKEITIDCEPDPCTLPAADELELVVVNSSLGCDVIGACINTTAGFGLSADYCIEWNWGDGNSQVNGANICPYYTYAADGTYTVCATLYCCNAPTETLTLCKEITIACEPEPCALPEASELELVLVNSSQGCDVIGACINTTAGFGLSADYCIEWNWGDGNSQENSANFCPYYTYAADGTYTVCATLYCCDAPADAITLCGEITIACEPEPCALPEASELELVLVNSSLGCDVIGACVNTLDGFGLSAEYCIDWNWGDGTSQYNAANFCPQHTYSQDGTYTVCATIFCCNAPADAITLCGEITIACEPEPCSLPDWDNLNLMVAIDEDNCGNVGTCVTLADGTPLGFEYCINWSWGDGTFQSVTAALCPTHTYEAASGTYTICAEVFCCADPANVVTICKTIEINCSACPTDLNGDGVVSAPDLLEILGNFGVVCTD